MSINESPPRQIHVPVLLEASIDTLRPAKGESYLDLTAGYGGHASVFLEKTGNYDDAVLVDRDDYATERLKFLLDKGARILHTDFVSASKALIKEGKKFDIVLADLGVSSPQLDQSERGFSFKNSGPLDMRMDRRQTVTAETIVNTASVDDLTRIISDYGEEPRGQAKAIATAIATHRPLSTTEELAALIKDNYRGRWKKIHPATRTFQALRIAVNDELRQIEDLLPFLPDLLNPGGRVGIISFHSLEDRLVKRFFKEQFELGLEATLQPLTKKPIAGDIYDVHNPRSRSAKLRVAVKN
jgi:16S rRNA (cytosine1402-N4)-methyltransferase